MIYSISKSIEDLKKNYSSLDNKLMLLLLSFHLYELVFRIFLGFERWNSSRNKKGHGLTLCRSFSMHERANEIHAGSTANKPHLCNTSSNANADRHPTKLMFGVSLSQQTVTQPSIRSFSIVQKLNDLCASRWLIQRRLPLLSPSHDRDSIHLALRYNASTVRNGLLSRACQFWYALRRSEETKALDSLLHLVEWY